MHVLNTFIVSYTSNDRRHSFIIDLWTYLAIIVMGIRSSMTYEDFDSHCF